MAWLDRHVLLSAKEIKQATFFFLFFLLFFYPQNVATEITFECTRFNICFFTLHYFCIYSFLFYFVEVTDIYAAVSLPLKNYPQALFYSRPNTILQVKTCNWLPLKARELIMWRRFQWLAVAAEPQVCKLKKSHQTILVVHVWGQVLLLLKTWMYSLTRRWIYGLKLEAMS